MAESVVRGESQLELQFAERRRNNAYGASVRGIPIEMGAGFEVMKKIKRTLDPNNIMNPGKNMLDLAYAAGWLRTMESAMGAGGPLSHRDEASAEEP